MKFIPSRDLRIRPGEVWKRLRAERELVITSNGRPVAVMIPVRDDNLAQTIQTMRRARLQETIRQMQRESVRKGLDRLTMAEIDEEIRRARLERRK